MDVSSKPGCNLVLMSEKLASSTNYLVLRSVEKQLLKQHVGNVIICKQSYSTKL
jgi:hypothetical protein